MTLKFPGIPNEREGWVEVIKEEKFYLLFKEMVFSNP